MHRGMRMVVVVATLALAGVACGGDEGGGATGGGGAEADLVTSGTAFNPTTVEVASGGDSIVIRNDDGFTHTFTLDDGSIDQQLAPGSTVTVEVNITEDAPFHCEIHASMTGTLTVS